MPHYPKQLEYSEKYYDEYYEYRHVILPKEIFKQLPFNRLLTEPEWRIMGISQSKGWINFTRHKPEPHILLFRRPMGTNSETGITPPDILTKIQEYETKKSKLFST
jgi:cyclin-dependent kinase regulatory subunit CKS1